MAAASDNSSVVFSFPAGSPVPETYHVCTFPTVSPVEKTAPTLKHYNDLPTYPVRPSFKDFQNSLRPSSQTVVFDGCPNDPYHPSSTPIYQTSTFVQPDIANFGPYDYTRSGNPTRTALEKHVALLEKAHAAFAFTSGMAALNTVMNTLLEVNDELIVGDDIYGGMHRLASKITSRQGVTVKFVDTTRLSLVANALGPQTKLVQSADPLHRYLGACRRRTPRACI